MHTLKWHNIDVASFQRWICTTSSAWATIQDQLFWLTWDHWRDCSGKHFPSAGKCQEWRGRHQHSLHCSQRCWASPRNAAPASTHAKHTLNIIIIGYGYGYHYACLGLELWLIRLELRRLWLQGLHRSNIECSRNKAVHVYKGRSLIDGGSIVCLQYLNIDHATPYSSLNSLPSPTGL